MYDQTPAGRLSSLVKLEEGLKTYGLLESIRGSPDRWRPVFVPGCAPSVTATTFLNKLVVEFSLSDVKKQQEIDVFYHFTNFIQSLDSAGLGKTLKWAVGASSIPPLGLPKKNSVQFLHGCTPDVNVVQRHLLVILESLFQFILIMKMM